MQTKWRYFLKTLGNPDMPFADVIAGIQEFLLPVWGSIVAETEFFNNWLASEKAWNKEKTL